MRIWAKQQLLSTQHRDPSLEKIQGAGQSTCGVRAHCRNHGSPLHPHQMDNQAAHRLGALGLQHSQNSKWPPAEVRRKQPHPQAPGCGGAWPSTRASGCPGRERRWRRHQALGCQGLLRRNRCETGQLAQGDRPPGPDRGSHQDYIIC